MTSKHRRRVGRGPRAFSRPILDSLSSDDDGVELKQRGAVLPQRARDATYRAEALYCAGLFAVSLLVRVWKIGYPASVVFDEVHFLRFVKNYRDGEYLFDIHPPLGKLILLTISKLFCTFPKRHLPHNGMPFGPDYSYVPLRLTSALFGAFTSPTLFLISRAFGLSIPASLIPAVAHTLDNLSIIESRAVVMDAQLTFFMAASLLSALHLFGSKIGSLSRKKYLACTTIFAACAVSVKWTTAVTPLLIAIISIIGFPFMRRSLRISEMAAAGTGAAFLYTMFFAIHFWLLPKSGEGDGFMPAPFQETLLNNSRYKENAPGMGFLNSFIYLNAEMYRANARIKTRHHWESKWYQWVINQRGLLYFDEPRMEKISRIYLIVNPAVGFAALGAVLTSFAVLVGLYLPKKFLRKLEPYSKLHAFASRATLLLIGYVLNLAPYLEVSRCTFLYHYIPPLFYAELILANVVDILPPKARWRACIALSTLFVTAFAFWSPWIYGTPLTSHGHKIRRLYGNKWT